MAKVILIYANCMAVTAKGDFVLAGALARDLTELVTGLALNGVVIALTSTLDGMARFEDLYGKAVAGRVNIEGQLVDLCALEHFSTVDHEVVAYIEANRCKFAPAELVKRVLSPDSKFLFVAAANKRAIETPCQTDRMITRCKFEQFGLYDHFNPEDMFFGTCGLGAHRQGLPKFKSIDQLPALSPEQESKIPGSAYGFMYLASVDKLKDYVMMIQYIRLSGELEYILIGDYAKKPVKLNCMLDGILDNPPTIHYHQSVENGLMRNMVKRSHANLVLSTGVMSTIEAMHDGKLTYYQARFINANFVQSYLLAVKSICASDSSLTGFVPDLIVQLSQLLFAEKPLNHVERRLTSALLGMPAVTGKSIEMNQRIIAQASGTLASQLLSCIGIRSSTNRRDQCISVCRSLCRPDEQSIPVYDEALRRAASLGLLLEMKILLSSMPPDEINKGDPSKKYTALHCAVSNKHLECAQLLLRAGASHDVGDADGRVPMFYAVQNADTAMIDLLASVGASAEPIQASVCQP